VRVGFAGKGGVRVGRKDEAGAQADAALRRGDHRAAKTHFLEALRLEPDNEWAKAGAVEALKARSPIYRALLHFQLRMSALPPGARLGVVIVGYLGYRGVLNLQKHYPDYALLLAPLVILYILFALLTVVGPAFFNLTLLPSTLGRQAMDKDQRRGAILFGSLLGAGIVVAALEIALQSAVGATKVSPIFAMPLLLAAIPGGLTFGLTDWRRAVMGGVTAVVALMSPLFILNAFALQLPDMVRAGALISLFGAIGSVWLANFLAVKER